MIVIAGAIIGAILGLLNARRQAGNRLDKLQYAVVGAIALGMVGLILTIVIHRSL